MWWFVLDTTCDKICKWLTTDSRLLHQYNWNIALTARDRSFNLQGGLFRSEFCFRTTQVRIFIFFVAQSANFFFHILTIGYMTKTLNHIIFFSSTKIRIFFSATLGIKYFFRMLIFLFFKSWEEIILSN